MLQGSDVSTWIDRQLPTNDEVFLDHVGYFVADLEQAGERFTRLGFNVSPINLQQNADETGTLRPSGTSNRLAVLRRGFIEVLAATHDTPLADQLKKAVARYEGLHLIALSHAEIPGERERLVAAGFAMQAIVRLRRHKQTPDGLREVAWSVLRPQADVMPEGRVQFAYCHTPDLTWPPDAPAPANGADAITDILLCVDDRREAAARFARYAGRPSIERGNASVIALDRGSIVLMEPKDTAGVLPDFDIPDVPFMAGQALRSADIAATRQLLDQRDVTPLFADDELICVGPADALGAYLLFHAASMRDPWDELAARR
jgi:catechol 2,3-dioxygenase-like lactoylglutathione lyase family enzyme